MTESYRALGLVAAEGYGLVGLALAAFSFFLFARLAYEWWSDDDEFTL